MNLIMESKYRERRMARSCNTSPAELLEAATKTARWWSGESSSDSAELADLIESFYHGEEKEMKVEEDEEAELDAGHRALTAVLDESEADPVARRFRAEAERAVGAVGFGHRGQGLKMRVVGWLREQGFDAGLCKSSWERFDDGVPAGHHHYIDVMNGGGGGCSTQRYILDLDFAAEFEIPRPSAAYAALLRRVPRTFSGTAGNLERIVSVMCAAIRESMRSAGMPLPPWRRKQYVEAKWLGGYERHTAEPLAPHWEVVERAEGWRKKAAWRVELDGREAERRRRMATA
ncbi:uncharacterized protein LOC122030284 [Zingiber officinale]|nr:uncharacterized protein LOC122030284 [Zingiber officinale]